MSWNHVLETGNGELEFRLKITGLDYEFVTNSFMERNNTNPTGETVKRRVGLKRNGFNISERVIIPESKIEIEGNTFTIVDVEQQATRAFRRQASRTALMMASRMRDTDTSIWVSNNRFSNGSIIWIGSEAMVITSDPSPTPGGFIYQVNRGALSTKPVFHYTTTDIEKTLNPTVQNVPFGIENQRVYLYAYGKGDDLQGDGTLIWKGVVIQDASFDGMDWRLEAGPITEVFKGDFGIDSEAIRFRGIHIPSYFQVTFERLTDETFDNAIDEKITIRIGPDPSFGNARGAPSFFETKEDFIAQLNRQVFLELSANGFDWGSEVPQFQIDERGHLTATYTSDAVDPRWIRMLAVPDRFGNSSLAFRGETDGRGSRSEYTFPKAKTSSITYEITEFTGIPIVFPNRSYYLNFQDVFPEQFTYLTQGIQYLHFNSAGFIFNKIANSFRLLDSEDKVLFGAQLISYSSLDNRAEISVPNIILNRDVRNPSIQNSYVIINNDHKVVAYRQFFAPATTLPGFLSEIVDLSTEYASQGIMPLFYDDDFNIADIQSQFDSFIIPSPIRYREYQLVKPSQTFEEFLTEELKLFGCYPVTDLNGSISIRRFRTISPSEVKNHVLNSSNILTDESFPVLITNKDGIWNSIKVKTGWDAFEEEHLGTTYTVNDIESISTLQGKVKRIEIGPFSGDSAGKAVADLAWANYILPLAERTISFIREKYETISVEVPMTLFSSSIGNTVSIRSKQLPSVFTLEGDNFRGQSVFNGFIIGRSFNLDEGSGRLEILVSNESIPAVLIPDTISYIGTTTIAPVVSPLTASVSSSYLDIVINDLGSRLPPNTSYVDLLTSNDRVRFTEWDSDSPFEDSARLDSFFLSGSNLVARVEFPTSVPPEISSNPSSFRLSFDKLDSGFDATENQLAYAYVDSGTKSAAIETAVGNITRRLKI